jgi:hypothetical protein
VGKSVVFDGPPDGRCYRGKLVVGEVNCRHSPDIIGRHLSIKESATCVAPARRRTHALIWSPAPLEERSHAAGARSGQFAFLAYALKRGISS